MSKSCVCFCGRSFVRGRNGLGKFCSVKCFQDYEQLSGIEIRKVEAKYLPVKPKREYVASESELVGHTVKYVPEIKDKTYKDLVEINRRVMLLPDKLKVVYWQSYFQEYSKNNKKFI